MFTKKPSICFVLGTRPEIIKLAPLIRECESRRVSYFTIHTNQHYDFNLDKIFFKELGIPAADYNLRIGSGTHGVASGRMIEKVEKILLSRRPDIVVVQGDTNTVLAGAIAAAKLDFCRVAHVEAGLRSYDRSMPEEINRIIADHVSDYLFCPTTDEARIARHEGIDSSKIFVTGNTIVDAVRHYSGTLQTKSILKYLHLTPGSFILLTCHRPSNVDSKAALAEIIAGIRSISEKYGVQCVFPIHPRTARSMKKFKLKMPSLIRQIEPVGYLDLLELQKNSLAVITDSGGIQEEACILKKKCLILRTNTERPETVKVGGAVILSRISRGDIVSKLDVLMKKKVAWHNPFGDGHASRRILDILLGYR